MVDEPIETPNLFAKDVWRLMVQRDARSFMLDELHLFIGYKDADGFRFVEPLEIKLTEVQPLDGRELPGPTRVPMELAELLMNHLAYVLLGKGDIVAEVHRLRKERDTANQRLDQLLMGLARGVRAT